MNEKLSPEQALDNLDNAVAALQVSRRDHYVLQQSVTCLREALDRLAKAEKDTRNAAGPAVG